MEVFILYVCLMFGLSSFNSVQAEMDVVNFRYFASFIFFLNQILYNRDPLVTENIVF